MAFRIIINPDIDLLGTSITADPDFLLEVEFQYGVTVTGEQQMLNIHRLEDRCTCEVDLDAECAVFERNDHVGKVPRRDVVLAGTRPVVGPPARHYADLIRSRIRSAVLHIERCGLHLLPSLRRNLGYSLAVSVGAFKGEAVCTVPSNGTVAFRIVILPNHSLYSCPITTVGSR